MGEFVGVASLDTTSNDIKIIGDSNTLAPSGFHRQLISRSAPESSGASREIDARLRYDSLFSDAVSTHQRRILNFESSFIAEQEWEGCVLSIYEGQITALLQDLSRPGLEEQAVFDVDEVSEIYRDLVKEGAIFRWSIGYQRQKGGTKSRLSSLVFRRMPAWNSKDLAKSQEEAEDILSGLQWA
ncbi:hypothetical protein NAV33_16540 [Pseudomonas stutzeri]|uniref:hypothetical protein n=1 Tax=Stutzerimonas stutzeri TaxID=316 RepID=UPI00210D1363|nr:hypothetical protein [Stutzerimonas stutzeri]MCQ4313484.1 hypothetical protein [Stutzerimonas stutzeri]